MVAPADRRKAGDPFTIRIDFGIPLAGLTAAEWLIGPATRDGRPTGEVALTRTLGAGVEVVDVDGTQRVAVTLSGEDTAAWSGNYAHECRITDASGVSRTAQYGPAGQERYYDIIYFEPDFYTA